MVRSLQRLSAVERGYVLGAALLGAGGPSPERALAEPQAGRCREALDALEDLAREERLRVVAELGRELMAPVPRGLAQVHRGWLRRALDAESTVVLGAVASGLGAEIEAIARELTDGRVSDGEDAPEPLDLANDPEMLDELRRAVFVAVEPCFADVRPDAGWALKACLDAAPDEVGPALVRVGAAVLAASLSGAPGDALARAAAEVGPPWAELVLAAKKQTCDAPSSRAARALVAAVNQAEQTSPEAKLNALGIGALIADAADEDLDALLVVSRRLPPSVGDRLVAAIARRFALAEVS